MIFVSGWTEQGEVQGRKRAKGKAVSPRAAVVLSSHGEHNDG